MADQSLPDRLDGVIDALMGHGDASAALRDPDLAPLTLPNDEAGWHDWLVERCDDQLERARGLVEQLRTRDGADAAAILEHWNQVATALSNAASAASVMSNVLPSEALRTQAEAAMQEAQKLSTDLTLDSELHAIFAGLDGSDLDADAQRLLAHVLRDFQRATSASGDAREQQP